jgi:hypothetical protein
LTTNQGLRISDDQNSLKLGPRGPVLLEDFILREKITHFDHERIPERVVHARGLAAHGYFELTASLADFLKDLGAAASVAGTAVMATRLLAAAPSAMALRRLTGMPPVSSLIACSPYLRNVAHTGAEYLTCSRRSMPNDTNERLGDNSFA